MTDPADIEQKLDAAIIKAAEFSSTINSFLAFLRQRMSVEEQYAKSVAKLGAMAISSETDESLVKSFEQMAADMANKSEQHEALANSIKSDLIPSVVELEETEARLAKMTAYSKKGVKQLRGVYERFRKARAKYEKAYDNAFNAASEAGMPVPDYWVAPTADWSCEGDPSFAVITVPVSDGRARAQREMDHGDESSWQKGKDAFRRAHAAANASGSIKYTWKTMFGGSSEDSVRRAAAGALSSLESSQSEAVDMWAALSRSRREVRRTVDQASERTHAHAGRMSLILHDVMRRYVVFESSLLANLQYDMQMLSREVESSQDQVTQRAVKTAARPASPPVAPAVRPTQAAYASSVLPPGPIEDCVDRIFSDGLRRSSEASDGVDSDDSEAREVDASIHTAVDQVIGLLEESVRDKAPADSINPLRRLVDALEMKRAETVQLSRKGFSQLVRLMSAALTVVVQTEQFSAGRSLMIIAQTFCTHAPTSADGDYVRDHVRDHPLWKDQRFWQAAVFESLGSAFTKLGPSNAEDRVQRERDVIFGQVGFFAHNMQAFGVDTNLILALMRKYAEFVKMPSTMWDELMAAVGPPFEHQPRTCPTSPASEAPQHFALSDSPAGNDTPADSRHTDQEASNDSGSSSEVSDETPPNAGDVQRVDMTSHATVSREEQPTDGTADEKL